MRHDTHPDPGRPAVSALVRTTLCCDRRPCTATYTADGWPGDVRVAARKAGWDTRDGDRCPTHPHGVDTPPPALFDLPVVTP